jgi:hypothetical protein
MTLEEIGNIQFESYQIRRLTTIKGLLQELLMALIHEEEGFSGKRPFGDSDWMGELYVPLIENQLVSGSLDELGDILSVDENQAKKLLFELIQSW